MRVRQQLVYFGRAALRGLAGSPLPSAAAIFTVALAVLPLGILWIAASNMRALLEVFESGLHITAFLHPEVEPDEARQLADRTAALPGVATVEIVSREEALQRLRARLDDADLLASLDENPLPISLEVALSPGRRDAEHFHSIREAVEALENVESAVGGGAWVRNYERALEVLHRTALGVGGLLGISALSIVAVAIRVGLYARQRELEILSAVGASRSFRNTPFLIEGWLQGSCGGLLGLGLLGLGAWAAAPRLRDTLTLFLGWSEPSFLDPAQMLGLVLASSLLGTAGAALAIATTRLP